MKFGIINITEKKEKLLLTSFGMFVGTLELHTFTLNSLNA